MKLGHLTQFRACLAPTHTCTYTNLPGFVYINVYICLYNSTISSLGGAYAEYTQSM